MQKVKEIIFRFIQYAECHPGAVKSLIAAVSFILGVQVSEKALLIIDAVIQFLGVLF